MSLLVCFFIICSNDVFAQASFERNTSSIAKEEHKSLYSNWQWLKGKEIDYVITPKDNKWDRMTYSEQLQASNPPMDLIKSVSDEDLVDLAINYPFLCDIFAFNSFDDAMQHFSYTSTIFYELDKRDIGSISDIILQRLDNHNVNYNKLVSNVSKEEADNYMKELFMEAFLAKKEVVKSLSQKEIGELLDVIDNKYEQKKDSCYDFSTSLFFYSTLQEELGEIPDRLVSEKISQKTVQDNKASAALSGFVSKNQVLQLSNGAWYTTGIYNKYGISNACYKYYSGDYTSAEKQIINECYDNHNWTRLRSATKKYNCHSYCWITTSSDNKYWLNSPQKFYSGINIIDNGINKKIQKGQYIVLYDGYGNIVHSLRAVSTSTGTSVNSYLNSTKTKSKLGTAGLYEAPLGDIFKLYSGFYYHTITNNN